MRKSRGRLVDSLGIACMGGWRNPTPHRSGYPGLAYLNHPRSKRPPSLQKPDLTVMRFSLDWFKRKIPFLCLRDESERKICGRLVYPLGIACMGRFHPPPNKPVSPVPDSINFPKPRSEGLTVARLNRSVYLPVLKYQVILN